MEKVSHLQEKIMSLSERLTEARNRLVETAAQAVNAFKEKGRTEMCKVLQKGISGMKSMLSGYRVVLCQKKVQVKRELHLNILNYTVSISSFLNSFQYFFSCSFGDS